MSSDIELRSDRWYLTTRELGGWDISVKHFPWRDSGKPFPWRKISAGLEVQPVTVRYDSPKLATFTDATGVQKVHVRNRLNVPLIVPVGALEEMES